MSKPTAGMVSRVPSVGGHQENSPLPTWRRPVHLSDRDAVGLRRVLQASRSFLQDVSVIVDSLPPSALVIRRLFMAMEALMVMETLQVCASLLTSAMTAVVLSRASAIEARIVSRLLRSEMVRRLTSLCLCMTWTFRGCADWSDSGCLARAVAAPTSTVRHLKFWVHAPLANIHQMAHVANLFACLGETAVRLEDADLGLFGPLAASPLSVGMFRAEGWNRCALRLHGPTVV